MSDPRSKARDLTPAKYPTENSHVVLRVARNATEKRLVQVNNNRVRTIFYSSPMARRVIFSLIYPLLSFLNFLTETTWTSKSGGKLKREIAEPVVKPRTVRKIDQRGGTGVSLLEDHARREKE